MNYNILFHSFNGSIDNCTLFLNSLISENSLEILVKIYPFNLFEKNNTIRETRRIK